MLNNLLLRLGFRGHDGKAKPGNLDENGNLKVALSGTVVETFTKTDIVLAAGASVVLNVTEMFPVVFAYNLLIEVAQTHDYALKEYFSIGTYAAQTVTTKEIEMESTPLSRIKKTGKLEAERPNFLRFILENKSTSSQTYNRVTATLFVRGDVR